MKAIKFIANGKDKNFDFKFPFFQKNDVIIEVNFQRAMKYNLICISNGVNADKPFCGGQVQFFRPPKQGSIITIKRKLPIKRIVDYQPTLPYSPVAHNQDMNYIIEILKDIQDFIDSLMTQPSESDNKEKIDAILQQITQIFSVIDELQKKIEQSDEIDLSDVYENLETLTDAIDLLNTLYNQLKAQVENIDTSVLPDDMDYVIASQLPTAENNYSWYRKYASGWIEQGGYVSVQSLSEGTATSATVEFSLKMGNTDYSVLTSPTATSSFTRLYSNFGSKTTTGMSVGVRNIGGTTNGIKIYWQVKGFGGQ